MKKLAIMLLGMCALISANQIEPQEIIEQVVKVPRGEGAVGTMKMDLVGRSGSVRSRTIKNYWNESAKELKSIRFFTSPADLRGTGLLIYDYNDTQKDDDQWLYIPSLKKVKGIPSNKMNQSFLGSDFNYSDMVKINPQDYTYEMLKEVEINGYKTWAIKCVPKSQEIAENTGYSKTIRFIRQDNFVPIRAILWVEGSKKVKFLDVTSLENIDGIWVKKRIEMTTKIDKRIQHKTVLEYIDVKFNQNFEDNIFTTKYLSSGIN